MQEPQQPGKILRWVKASERLPEKDKSVCGRSLGRYLLIEFPSNEDIRIGKITCANMEVLEEWYPGIEWLEETEDLSAPASPVEEKREEAIDFARWINNSWYTPHYSKWIHLREGLAGMKTVEELWDLFQQSKKNKDGK